MEELLPSSECMCDKFECEPSVNDSVQNEEFVASRTGISFRLYWRVRQRVWSIASSGGSLRGLQDRDIAPAFELSALKPGSRVAVCPAFGVRWIVVSPDGTWIDVHINLVVALRNVTGKANISKGG